MKCTMSAEEEIRLDRVCRSCLREESGMRSLFEGLPVAPHRMLAALSSSGDPIAEGDGLPHQICSPCADKLAAAYSFQRACERSAVRLKRSLRPGEAATPDLGFHAVIKSEFNEEDNNKTDCLGANLKTRSSGIDESVQTLAEYFQVYNCPVCQKKFRSLFGLNSHLRRHSGPDEPACPACGRLCPCERERGAGERQHPSAGHVRKKRDFKAKINNIHMTDNRLTLNCQNCKNCFESVKSFENHICHSESGEVPEGWAEAPGLAGGIKEEPPEAYESPAPPSPCRSDENLTDEVKREVSCDDSDYEPLKYIKSKDKKCEKTIKLKKTSKLRPASTESASGTLSCVLCPRVFASKTQLDVHAAKHSGKTIPYSCSICHRTFTRYSHLKRHGVVHSPSRRLNCTECKKTFTRPEHLQRHLRNHAEGKASPPPVRRRRSAALLPRDKVAFCEDCGRGFCSLRSLQRHVLRLHPAGITFSCSVCERTFPSRKPLREHEARHRTLTRPLLCSECGSSFRRSGDLAVHMRRHRGEKPYSCRFCPKAFPRSTDLVTHERYHTEDKAHACAVCGKTFHRQYNLKVHLRVHSGERPYSCPHCDRAFAQSNDLKAHVRRHTGERFACELCGEGFLQSYLLAAHKRRAHQLDCTSHIRRVEKHPTEAAPRTPRAQHRASRQQLAARMAALLLAQPAAPPSP